MRLAAAVAFIAASIAACNTPYGTAPATIDGGTDGDASDAGTSQDGASITEAGADADPDADTRGKPVRVTIHPGTTFIGVAASDTNIFFTEPGTPGIIWSRDQAQGGIEKALPTTEVGLGTIKVTGPDEIQWSKALAGMDGVAGVFKSTFIGKDRSPATMTDMPGCGSFAYSQPNIYHCAILGSSQIQRAEGIFLTANWATTAATGTFMDGYTDMLGMRFVVWSEPTRIRTANAGDGDSTAATTILDGILQPAGVAVKSPWVYFTQRDGSIHRVKLDGTMHTTLFAPVVPPPSIADITVAPDGLNIYWAQGAEILGLSVTP